MERQLITKSSQLLNPEKLTVSVSKMISEYNSVNPYEMLPKTPEVILNQLDNGLSVALVDSENEEVLYHGSLYPNFENGEEDILGCQIVELGSWIVPTRYRGNNLGTIGLAALIALGEERWKNPLFISTHKRVGALKVSQRNGLELVPYSAVPYLTYLTCTCVNCSETVGKICGYRRTTSEIVVYENGKMDCTLVTSSKARAAIFEQSCRTVHQNILGEEIIPGPITIDSMLKARQFYDSLKK